MYALIVQQKRQNYDLLQNNDIKSYVCCGMGK